MYADLTQAGDYQSSMDKIIKAQDAFLTLPSDVRKRFGNDPQAFLAYMDDPANMEESIKLGLRIKKDDPKPDPILSELQTLNKNLSQSKKAQKSEE